MSTQVSPYTIVFSLYGGYVLPRGEEIWIGSLIQTLATLDFTEGATRTIISRMKREGYLESRRIGRRSFYRLTELGLKNVRWGGKRAFGPSDSEWDRQWTVVVYSVPEKHRERRDALRDSLKSWGFGGLAPGVWLSPYPFSPEAEGKWRKLEVWHYLEIFRAEHLGPGGLCEIVAQAWPELPALGERYRSYVVQYESVLRCFESGALEDEECFAARLQSLFEFVAITLDDPALPSSLLPDDWPRPCAQSLHKELRQALTEPAERFFDSIYERGGQTDDERKQS